MTQDFSAAPRPYDTQEKQPASTGSIADTTADVAAAAPQEISQSPASGAPTIAAARAMDATGAISRQDQQQEFPTGIAPNVARRSSGLYIDIGPTFMTVRGVLPNSFSQHLQYEPDTFRTVTVSTGFTAGLGMALPLTDWMSATFAMRYTHAFFTYEASTTAPITEYNPQPGTPGTAELRYTAAITLGEFWFAPAIRLEPFGDGMYLEAGMATGLVVLQSALYSGMPYLPSGVWLQVRQMPEPRYNTHAGTPRMQTDVTLALGGTLRLSRILTLEIAGRGAYGLQSLYTDNDIRVWSITPSIAIQVRP